MITLDFDKNTADRVKAFVDSVGTFNRKSGGNGSPVMQMRGFYAEAMTKLWLGFSEEEAFSFEKVQGWDKGVDFVADGLKWDIKCKSYARQTAPSGHHQTFIPQAQVEGRGYESDAYLFTSYNRATGELCIFGTLDKEQAKDADLIRKGEEYIAGGERHIGRMDSYNPFYRDMKPVNSPADIHYYL